MKKKKKFKISKPLSTSSSPFTYTLDQIRPGAYEGDATVKMLTWYKFMLTVPVAKRVYDEMLPSLEKWKSNGIFNPIIEEMKSS